MNSNRPSNNAICWCTTPTWTTTTPLVLVVVQQQIAFTMRHQPWITQTRASIWSPKPCPSTITCQTTNNNNSSNTNINRQAMQTVNRIQATIVLPITQVRTVAVRHWDIKQPSNTANIHHHRHQRPCRTATVQPTNCQTDVPKSPKSIATSTTRYGCVHSNLDCSAQLMWFFCSVLKTQNSNQSIITRPKRQLQYTPTTQHPQRTHTVAAAMASSKSSINSMKKRRLIPHQSSPSSHSTSSSSSISLKQRQSMRQLTPATTKSHDDPDEEYTGEDPMARQKHVNNDLSDISSDEALSPAHVNNNNSMKTETHVANQTSEPNEPLYCTCQQVSYGQMILCDNHTCTLEWFHFDCVDLQSKPKGKWYCPNCRGDTHKVMKKMNNQNQSTSRNK